MLEFLGKTAASVAVGLIGLIPTWMYLGARQLLSPEGFFSEFFVFGVGVWLLGGAQLILFAIVGMCLMIIWGE